MSYSVLSALCQLALEELSTTYRSVHMIPTGFSITVLPASLCIYAIWVLFVQPNVWLHHRDRKQI